MLGFAGGDPLDHAGVPLDVLAARRQAVGTEEASREQEGGPPVAVQQQVDSRVRRADARQAEDGGSLSAEEVRRDVDVVVERWLPAGGRRRSLREPIEGPAVLFGEAVREVHVLLIACRVVTHELRAEGADVLIIELVPAAKFVADLLRERFGDASRAHL